METVVVTGANRGIGLELCKAYLEAGWQVVAACRDPDSAAALQTLAGDALRVLPLDVASANSVQTFRQALDKTPVDVLINNAGVMGGERQSLEDIDYDAWLETFQVNSIAPHRVSSALLPNLRLSKRPRILTISSQMGAFGLDMDSSPYAYCSSKTAASKVMQIMAKDLKEDGVVVCPVHPGWVQTDMGGPNAQLTAQQCAQGLLKLADGLDMSHSGRFWTWDGNEHVW